MTISQLLLVLDFGGTKLSAAVAVPGGRAWEDWRQARSPEGSTAQTDVEIVCHLAREMLAGLTPSAIGVSFGGPVASERGIVRLSHHVPGWEDFPLAERLQAELGARAVVENDANAAALGEWRYGAGQGCDSLLYVTVSTGVGGGWIVNRSLWRGADGLAGEIGHLVLRPEGPLCTCGTRGCVEALAAGPYLAARARDALLADPSAGAQLRARVQGDLSGLTAEHVALAAQDGDGLAWQVLSDAARALGEGIGAALALMNPQRVVVGGGVAKSGAGYWRAMREAAATRVLPGVRVEIVPAALGDDAPLWGAVALAEALLIPPS